MLSSCIFFKACFCLDEMWHYVGGPPSRQPLCFGAKPDKGFGLEISTWPEVERECQSESWTKELREGSWQWRGAVGSIRDQSTWERVQHQWGKTSQDESAFLVALWKFREGCTSALVYRFTKECRVSQLNLLELELTQAHIVCLFFPPTPLIVFLVAMKKCAIPPSELLDDSPAKIEMV